MKSILTVTILFFSLISFAQKPIEKSIGEFSELKVYDLIQVELIKSNENKVIISGKNNDDVLVNNKNGKLKIKMNLESIFNGDDTKVTLYYTSFDILDVNEGAKIVSKDEIKQYEVGLKSQEGGTIDVKVNATYLNIKAVTGGVITVTGYAKNQKVTLLTGGVYEGETLKTEKSKVLIKAAGKAYIHASKVVDIKIRVGGDVFIYGNPETVNESIVLGGRVKRMD